MMDVEHIDLVIYAKTYGLYYFIGFSICVVVYACWPSNKAKFDDAAMSVLEDEDKPCQ